MTTVILEDLRKRRQGPAFYKPTLRTVLYRESEIDAWVAESRVQTRPVPKS
ncbi:helix-turn-helix transcriptional regulator [Microbacterium sp. NPDC090007]|uniref:helix-turn-helix transcriptional regulator n=1 Tax=Microbacterium sp. NPDC090007 TaxID=3364204 RepID=UPI003818ED5C